MQLGTANDHAVIAPLHHVGIGIGIGLLAGRQAAVALGIRDALYDTDVLFLHLLHIGHDAFVIDWLVWHPARRRDQGHDGAVGGVRQHVRIVQ